MQHDRRTEERIRSKGLVTLMSDDHQPLPAEVHDISRTRISLMVDRAFHPGTRVQVDTGHLAAEGVVVHCSARGEQHYIGIAFDPPTAA